jgi:hypothetical protein
MNYGFKYLVVMRDSNGHSKVAGVKADNAKEAKTIASKVWPKYTINSVKPSISLHSPLNF